MTFTDRFELDRLAEELAERELLQVKRPEDGPVHELPLLIPLSHNNPFLTAPTFDVENFLLSRSYTSLSDLRTELRDYLSVLKEELVKLINDDYEAFISLSTDLKGEGERLEAMKSPLSPIKSQVMVSRTQLQTVQEAVQEKLDKRSKLREEKALLHLLLKISDCISRLESLLLIAPPEKDGTKQGGAHPRPALQLVHSDQSVGERISGSRANHLGRVATEYTQLCYHVSKAKVERCVFVDSIQWRIDRIQSTLSSDLDHLFTTILLDLTEGKGKARLHEAEKGKLVADLTECLRAYDTLALWNDAEEVIRREIVRGFVKKTIHAGSLSAPHSPIVPHTPYPTHHIPGPFTSGLPPRTPYTPFTAFASKQNPFDFQTNPTSSFQSPYAHLLDDKDDVLAHLYNQLLRFVEKDLSMIMGIAEKVSLRSIPVSRSEKSIQPFTTPLNSMDAPAKTGQGFNIMANVIWDEFGRAISEDLGGFVFAAGQPDQFRKHYETSQAFIRCLEFLAPSLESIAVMRQHPVYISFQRRWQLPVYFQLRWKEVINTLEEVLSITRPEIASGKSEFATRQAKAVWVAIADCWSADVFIPDLGHRFWRLTLQIIHRYRTWIDECLSSVVSSIKTPGVIALVAERSSSVPRSSTPALADTSSVEDAAADEFVLLQCSALLVDVRAIHSQVLTMWREEISMMLLGVHANQNDSDTSLTESTLHHVLSQLTSLIPSFSTHIITILTRRCCDALVPVRSIPSQFRAMSNKRSPTEPSYFISNIFRPIKTFFGIGVNDGLGSQLKEEFMKPFAEEIFEAVCQRYITYITAMKKTEDSLRKLKKGKQGTFSLFGTASSQDEGRDEERIRSQMMIDVQAFKRDAESLGVETDGHVTFKSLFDIVHAVD